MVSSCSIRAGQEKDACASRRMVDLESMIPPGVEIVVFPVNVLDKFTGTRNARCGRTPAVYITPFTDTRLLNYNAAKASPDCM